MIQSLLKRYVSNEPLAHPLTRSLAPLTHSLASYCSLHTARFARALRCAHSFARTAHSLARFARSPLRSFARSLANSLPNSWDNGIFLSNFECVLNHCVYWANDMQPPIALLLLRSWDMKKVHFVALALREYCEFGNYQN